MGTLDSIGMGISMSGISGLGMGFSMSTRGNDQERTKRLEEVIARIKARPGRVSPEGIKLLGERTGMDTAMEEKNGTTLCMIAGGSVLVDVRGVKTRSISSTDTCRSNSIRSIRSMT